MLPCEHHAEFVHNLSLYEDKHETLSAFRKQLCRAVEDGSEERTMLVNRSRQMEKRDEKREFIQTKQTGINEVLLLTQCFIWESILAYLACVCYENCLFCFIYLFSCTFQFFKKIK